MYIMIVKPAYYNDNKKYAGIFAGVTIRRDIGKVTIYRVRRGNGYVGAKKGVTYQDAYPYFVNDPNADHVGIENKNDFAAAITSWHSLTDEQRATWTADAERRKLNMSGFNLYIRHWRLGLIP